MIKNLFLPIIGVCALIVFVGLLSQGKLTFLKNVAINGTKETSNRELKTIKINSTTLEVEIADSNEERAKGLSDRDSLEKDKGMLFVFSSSSKANFWMKDTKIPLDIIWIKNNKVVSINKNVQPEPGKKDSELQVYPSPGEIDYVLEVNAGFSEKNNIKPNSPVSI